MAPKRQSEMAKIVIRALIAGIFVSILNACIAGKLSEPKRRYRAFLSRNISVNV